MLSRILIKKQPGRRPVTALAVLGLLGGMLLAGGTALAVHDNGKFELDKNATNNLNVTKLGELGANITATATSIPVCQTGTAPAGTFTILIEAERMSVTATAGGTFGGNCAGTKRSYTVSRGFGGTAATAHSKGGVEGLISLVVAATKDGPDWNQVHAAIQADPDSTCSTFGLVECSFVSDQIGPTTFIGGGSKDHLPINGWQHTTGSSPDKAEILNAYAAKAIEADGDQVLYFGMDRYATDGSTDIGFWFFKNPVSVNPDGTFTGTHAGTPTVPGDILILGTFTQGGATTNIRVFRWVGAGGNESNTIQGPDADFGDCIQDPPLTGDNGCATVNDTSIEVPWTYTFKGSAKSGWVPTGGFYEGGVNLTAIGLAGCFSSFLAETRSSPEITAILKDFAGGSFEACESTLTTTPKRADGVTNVGTDLSIGTGGSVQVTDSANLVIGGTPTWSGSLKFFLCSPAQLLPAANTGTCTSGGTRVQGATEPADGIPVSNTTTMPVVSAAATVTAAANGTTGAPGRYCWRGEFTTTTSGVPPATDARATECFVVQPVQPNLSTQAINADGSNVSAAVPFGQAIFDKASLTGTANKPGTPVVNPTTAGLAAGGTITFKLYGPAATSTPTTTECNTLAAGFATAFPTGIQRAVNGDSSATNVYSTIGDGFTPAAPGFYFWKADYSGDNPNTLSATHNANCAASAERVEVLQLNPGISTAQSFVPNDSATITVGSGGGNLAGTVVFKLYVNDAMCAGTPAYTTSPAIDITTGTGTGLSRTVLSANETSYGATGTTNFRWVVEYTSTNPAHTNASSPCGKEISSITINNNAP